MSNPYKRSDPKKLEQDRKEIERSMREFENQAPKAVQKKPSLIERAKRSIKKFMDEGHARRHPMPSEEGARVTGFKPKNRKVDA